MLCLKHPTFLLQAKSSPSNPIPKKDNDKDVLLFMLVFKRSLMFPAVMLMIACGMFEQQFSVKRSEALHLYGVLR